MSSTSPIIVAAIVIFSLLILGVGGYFLYKAVKKTPDDSGTYGPVYHIKLAGDPSWGISAQGTMSQQLGGYHFFNNQLLLASNPSMALGALVPPYNNADAGLLSASAPFTTFDADAIVGTTQPLILTGTNQALTRFGGVGLQEGAKLVTYENVMPHFNQGWILAEATA